MVEKNREIPVTNRSSCLVGYTIPDLGDRHDIRRQFAVRETKKITFEELEALTWVPGGDIILQDYLVIKDPEALKELFPDTQPEYYYTKEDVIKLLEQGSYNQFLDCLDFAPEGVLEMVKSLAVSLPLNDIEKIKAIQKKLNFDVLKAIEFEADRKNKQDNKGTDETAAAPKEEKPSPSGRRAAPINDSSVHNYKVVEK